MMQMAYTKKKRKKRKGQEKKIDRISDVFKSGDRLVFFGTISFTKRNVCFCIYCGQKHVHSSVFNRFCRRLYF